MASVLPSAFTLKLQCTCIGCKKGVKKVLQKYPGVEHSSKIDENEGEFTISGTADPQALIAAIFKESGKKVVLLKSNQDQDIEIVPPNSSEGGVHDLPHTKQSPNNQQSKLKGIVDHDTLKIPTSMKNQTSHDHILELKMYGKRFPCNGCRQDGLGPRYRCKRDCEYELHKECRFPKPKISHEFLQGYILEFLDELPSKKSKTYCIACGRNICGYVYHNKAKGWNLHPCCSNLKTELCIDSVNFKLHDEVLSTCMWCKKKDPQGHKTCILGWSYISTCKEYHFHIYCVTEMVHEAWKKGDIDNIDSIELELENMDQQLWDGSKKKKKNGKGTKIAKTIVKMFLKSIVGILFGDPSMIIAAVVPSVIELISNN